ncbi:hypothetical protein OESDEN_08189 [Oesophagostomum dentatum]|uniref:Mos1 transposase HTH domain-containing protein n=1 Tax=Oesophagostomum dentatum TaxID=61180 RepID=A0A0B1T702_OESDE|nr:hypothetical protein OESDEN_08189 [Oesophagostomum dentatum]
MLGSIVKMLQEHLSQVNKSDHLTANDVASFFNDYLLKYYESDDWDIREVPESEWATARRIGEEVQRLWGRLPGDGLDDVPYAEMCQLVEIIKSHASRIDLGKKSLVRITDVKDFYDLCQSLRTDAESPESLQDCLDEVIELDSFERQQRKMRDPNADAPVPVVFSKTDERGTNFQEKLGKALDNACDGESAIPEEVPAVALLQQPVPHVDVSLGTSDSSSDLLSHIGGSLGRSAKSRKVGPVAAVQISGRSYPFASNAQPVDLKPVALFHFRQGLSAKMTMAEIVSTFGEDSVADYQVTEWYDEFYQKYHHVGSAASSTQSQAQNRLIRALLEADPNKTIPQLAAEFGTSVEVMVSYLRMNGILRSVKRTVLNERQRRNRMEICSGLTYRQERDPTFLDRIVTYGEVWVGTAGHKESSTMIAVWWTSSAVVYFYVVAGGNMTSQLYFYHVTEMHKKLLKMRGGKAEDLILLHDNQLPYISLGAIRAIHQLGYEILQLPEKCSDLLPTDYHIVPSFRQFLIGRMFSNDYQLMRCFSVFMHSKDVQFYKSGIYDLVERWKKCFDASGDYFKP